MIPDFTKAAGNNDLLQWVNYSVKIEIQYAMFSGFTDFVCAIILSLGVILRINSECVASCWLRFLAVIRTFNLNMQTYSRVWSCFSID